MFVVEKKTFVTGVQVDRLQLSSGVCTNSPHEAQRLGDRRNDIGVLDLKLGIMNVAETPIERSMEICNAGREGCSNEIQRGCRVEVCAVFVSETRDEKRWERWKEALPDES